MINKLMNTEYDAIIIGTGIGGGTTGHALAKKGMKVLFIEKGLNNHNNQSSIKGNYAEVSFNNKFNNKNILKNSGRYFDNLIENTSKIPFIGSGTGGSSAIYGMAMERFFPLDFEKRDSDIEDIKQSNLPDDGWPFKYNELLPYYIKAETQYGVKGIGDILRGNEKFGYMPPPEITNCNKKIFNYLTSKNFSPYVLPRASNFNKDCIECQGFLCPKNCKIDSYTACVKPAVENYSAEIITDCNVEKIILKKDYATSVEVSFQNKRFQINGNIIVLAAGAISTPYILLKSKTFEHPNGISNKSGYVGKNLMRHLIDIYLLKTEEKIPKFGFLKEIAMNDLYNHPNGRLGTLQSFGRLPDYSIIGDTLIAKLSKKLHLPKSIFKITKQLLIPTLNYYFSRKVVMNSILEDLPYKANRITIDSETQLPKIEYNLFSYEKNLIEASRNEIKNIFKELGVKLIKQAEDNKRLAHVCGTCRSGNNPTTSVVNKNCRSHEIKNLYITDSSIFPTSGSTNPALTIAANALRISDKLY
jgi:choline dehydrogenase-like flavoprotein